MQTKPQSVHENHSCRDVNKYLKNGSVEQVWFVWVELTVQDDERVREHVADVVGLEYGAYNRVAFESSEGKQYFCPQKGSQSGGVGSTVEKSARTLTFSLPKEPKILAKAIEAIRCVHSYEEPVIYITEGMASRANYGANRENPNRWWNHGVDG